MLSAILDGYFIYSQNVGLLRLSFPRRSLSDKVKQSLKRHSREGVCLIMQKLPGVIATLAKAGGSNLLLMLDLQTDGIASLRSQ